MTLSAAKLKPGDQHSQVVAEDLTRTQIVQYAGASGDYNPLHTDEPFARDVAGYPGVFAHGMLTMGLTRTRAHRLGRRRPAARVRGSLHRAGLAG